MLAMLAILAVLLLPLSLAARAANEDNSQPNQSAGASSEELREIRQLLRSQQARIAALEEELRKAHSAAHDTTVNSSEVKAQDPTSPRKEELATRVGTESRLPSLGPFTFSGDFRLRDEPFFGGPANQSQVRNRERFRLRFNVEAKLNDDVSGGFSLSTGDLNDPISTNQTANQFYTRKPFNLDRAFINYRPGYLKALTLTGGKFAYPWCSTELTWDKDLNPEGLAQTLAFNLESTPVLKRVALVGFELPFAETAGVSLANKSIVQSAVYGGQLQTTWQLADWLKLSTYGGFYNWHNADPVALAVATANAGSPVNGLLPLKTNNVQNSLIVTTATQVITVNGTPQPTGVARIAGAQFASRFGLLDGIARFDIKTSRPRWPITLIGDYVQNTRACANVGTVLAPPANTSTVTYSQSVNAPCNSHQRRGYWAEARFGRAQEKGDWQFAYTRIFIEREAVLSVFNYSEIRQGSNVTQHRADVAYQAYGNVQLGLIGFFGRPLNFGSSAPAENILKRLQFDVIYKF
jgi:type II secretory pathway pseudopilin PulG